MKGETMKRRELCLRQFLAILTMLRRSHGGFRLGQKLVRLWQWVLRRLHAYIHLQQHCATGGGGGNYSCYRGCATSKLVLVLWWAGRWHGG